MPSALGTPLWLPEYGDTFSSDTIDCVDEQDRVAQYDSAEADQPASFDDRQWFTYAIGAVVMSASNMDVSAGTLYASLLKSQVAAAVAYGQAFDVTRQACLAAIETLSSQPVYEQAKGALGRAKQLYEERNQIAHGLWGGESGPVNNPRRGVRYQRHGKTRDVEWTQKGLMLLAGSLIDMANELNDLAARIRQVR